MFTIVMVAAPYRSASTAADQCGDLMARATAAAGELNRYGSRADATTSKALTLAREARKAVADAVGACEGTKQEVALKVSAANIEGIERALLDAKTERVHDTGIFPPPDAH